MGGVGIKEILVLFISLLPIFLLVSMGGGGLRRRAGPVMVLKKFRVSRSPADGLFIDTEGRQPRHVGWLLNVIGFGATTTLQVSSQWIYFKRAALSGHQNTLCPLSHVASAQCGYTKPIALLIVGALIVLGGIIGAVAADQGNAPILLVGLIIGGPFILFYFLKKEMTLVVETFGGSHFGLRFKPSVIENVSVDENRVLQAVVLLHQKMQEAQIHVVTP